MGERNGLTIPGQILPPVFPGLAPGLLGDTAALHGRYDARHWNFPKITVHS